MAHQLLDLSELAELFRERVLSMDALKQYRIHLRCAEYPGVEKFDRERDEIEKEWPAHAGDVSLCRAPAYIWESHAANPAPHLHSVLDIRAWQADGAQWLGKHT